MRFDVLTLFPEIFQGYLSQSILKLALDKGIVTLNLWNIRDWAKGKHKSVDDRPFGGGPGMVLKPEPLFAAVEAIVAQRRAETDASRRSLAEAPRERRRVEGGCAIVLTSPSGGMTNFMMPAAAVPLFSGPLYAYFGIQPNNPNNIGLAGTLGHVQIVGVASPIDESFATPALDSGVWQVVAQDPAGVIPVPPDALFWLTWTVPDVGFRLQTSFTLPGGWSDLPLFNNQLGNRKRTLVYQSSLPTSSTGSYFFRLVK